MGYCHSLKSFPIILNDIVPIGDQQKLQQRLTHPISINKKSI
jgi:hypothetical protein